MRLTVISTHVGTTFEVGTSNSKEATYIGIAIYHVDRLAVTSKVYKMPASPTAHLHQLPPPRWPDQVGPRGRLLLRDGRRWTTKRPRPSRSDRGRSDG